MLTLYHYWSSVCSQKARFCLAEKGLEWQCRHIDLFKFDHWQPGFQEAFSFANPDADDLVQQYRAGQ